LQAANAEREEADAPSVDARGGALDVRRIEDEAAHHEERENAHRKIEVKNPAPGIVVGDPAAKSGAEDGSEQDTQAVDGHGLAVLFPGEGLEKDGLGKRLKAAAGEALQDAKENQRGEAGGHAAKQRSKRESGYAGEEEFSPSKVAREPTRDGKDDGIGNEVGSDDPSAFFDGRSEVSGDVRDGDVDDSGVEDLHEGRQHDGKGDDPRIYARGGDGVQARLLL